ncbi:cytochrome P450 [Bacillus sp. HMF5848]|uniref:cytochrome P450 n=1 Tax=Bacillus sp. HMF5848 TaxID=2495421 RepID=UPI000F77B52F|nr:cytochrome P450 [Bacillus sp. HMF5848]RSK25796.1 cytochrome P450 [Bacillus sp. HMF5848]
MKDATIDGPRASFIGGHLLEFRQDPLAFLNKLRAHYKDVAKIRFGKEPIYVVMNPDMIKEVLVSKAGVFIKSEAFNELKPFLGEGLLTSEGDFHMRQRRMMQPSFTKKHIQVYADTMKNVAYEAIESWQSDKERIINVDMMNVALAIISKTMFSMDVNESHDTIGPPIDTGMHIATKRMRALVKIPHSIPTKENQQFMNAIKVLDGVVYDIIRSRRESTAEHDDLLGILMAARDEDDQSKMTDQQLRDEVMTIFLAGHETTANAMSWALYLLAKNPVVQEKAHKELDDVLGDRQIELEDVEKLSYLKQVIQESLRLYPPAWMFGREALEDVQIGELLVPKGETVFVSPYITHRLDEYFEEPDQFNPDRFNNDFLKTIPSYAFFPFGGGPRVCIGNHFAMLEATIVLATVLQHFTFTMSSSMAIVEPEPLITLRPKGGLLLRVNKRL